MKKMKKDYEKLVEKVKSCYGDNKDNVYGDGDNVYEVKDTTTGAVTPANSEISVILYGAGFPSGYVYAAPTYPPEGIPWVETKPYSPPLTERAAREMIESLIKKLDAIEKKVDKLSKKKSTKKRVVKK